MVVDDVVVERQRPPVFGLRLRRLAGLPQRIAEIPAIRRQVHVEEDLAGLLIDQLPEDRQRLATLGLGLRRLASLREEPAQIAVAASQLLPEVGVFGVLV